jgi:hypothetical protein
MRGMPKTWNTKQDVLLSLEHWPDETKAALQQLLDAKDDWLIVKKLTDGETGTEDATHRVREVTDESGTVVERYQEEYVEDPNGRIYRLGFSGPDEVRDLL